MPIVVKCSLLMFLGCLSSMIAQGQPEIKKSSSILDRLQVGLTVGAQINPINSGDILTQDVKAMTKAVAQANQNSSSTNPPATVSRLDSNIFAAPVGLTWQTIFFDFLRVRLGLTYDLSTTATNEYTDKSSEANIIYRSELKVNQMQFPLLVMFDIPVSNKNTIYLGLGVTTFFSTIEKTITETRTDSMHVDTDRISGLAFGPTFIIGVQRKIMSLISISADLIFQQGAKGGFVDEVQNASTNNNPEGFSDLTNNKDAELYNNGNFNTGTPQIMNYEGLRFLVSVNFHLNL